jgi:hypothetical protein
MSAEVIIAFIAVVGTGLGTLGATIASNSAAVKREAEQYKRQTEDQRRTETIKACEDLAANALLIVLGRPPDDQTMSRVVTRVQLLAPKAISDQAWELYGTASASADALAKAETDIERREPSKAALGAHDDFIALVRRELSTSN